MAQWKPYGRLDAHVEAAARHLEATQPYFEIKEIVELVKTGIPQTRLRGLAGILQEIRRATREWAYEVEEALTGRVEKRARDYLHQTKRYKFSGERVEVRVYEEYRDAEGRYRWQPIKGMTADQLEACVLQRQRRRRGEEIRIDVYEALVAYLRQFRPGATVGEVQDQVLEAEA